MPLFDVRHLGKTYYGEAVDTSVLHDLTFSIEQGEFVSIMGPSGSGKSTLLHILGFLSTFTAGEYYFQGKSFRDYSEEEAAQLRNKEMGFVFQTFNLLPRQTIYENVSLPLMYSQIPEEEWDGRIREVIDIVDLSHRIDYEAYKLSGGERQRTAIARALVNEPNVVFADEPTGNIDSAAGEVVMDTLTRLHEDMGHTVILITHEEHIAEYAHRMLYLKDGKIERDEAI